MAITNSTPENDDRPVSELHQRTADWRFLGLANAKGKKVAIIQRVREMGKSHPLAVGAALDGVTLKAAQREGLLVALGEETREIAPTQGAAFNLEQIEIPTELSDSPAQLVDRVYAQTLGLYLPEPLSNLEINSPDQPDPDMVTALAEELNLPSPPTGETFEQWIQDQGTSLIPPHSSEKANSGFTLGEDQRKQILGF